MGRIVVSVKIENPSDPDGKMRCDALVDRDFGTFTMKSFFLR